MSADLHIRDATVGDVPAIAAMMEEFFDYLCALDGSTSDFVRADGERKLLNDGFGRRPLFEAIIAETAGGPAGYAIFNMIYWPDNLQATLLMSDLFVKAAHRGAGVGKAIMDHLDKIGREVGCEQIMWTVWRPNAAAGRFYTRLGAEELPDEYVMRLPIGD
ncbi:MAG: N-acetyltransferase family protein [Parvibaculaceae bacterium]